VAHNDETNHSSTRVPNGIVQPRPEGDYRTPTTTAKSPERVRSPQRSRSTTRPPDTLFAGSVIGGRRMGRPRVVATVAQSSARSSGWRVASWRMRSRQGRCSDSNFAASLVRLRRQAFELANPRDHVANGIETFR
jgi:hypothetical protein